MNEVMSAKGFVAGFYRDEDERSPCERDSGCQASNQMRGLRGAGRTSRLSVPAVQDPWERWLWEGLYAPTGGRMSCVGA